MTTIAANLKEMCSDSCLSWDADFMLVAEKVRVINHEIVGCAGDEGEIVKFLRWFQQKGPEWPEFSQDEDAEGFTALVLNEKGLWVYGGTCMANKVMEPHAAIGSGGMVARAELHRGRSPKVAVETACIYDKNSKPPVQRITLKQALRGKKPS
jgi:hypothetical protein